MVLNACCGSCPSSFALGVQVSYCSYVNNCGRAYDDGSFHEIGRLSIFEYTDA